MENTQQESQNADYVEKNWTYLHSEEERNVFLFIFYVWSQDFSKIGQQTKLDIQV